MTVLIVVMKRCRFCYPLSVLVIAIAMLAGCTTSKPAKNFIVFPPPPDPPRIQYLFSFGSQTDLGGRGGLDEFIVGSEQVHRPIIKPYGVAIRKGKIYVCDTQAANISIADLATRKLRYLKPAGLAAMQLPANIVVDADETIYVTDTGRGQILIYDQAGNLLHAIGKKGETKYAGLAVTADRILATDMQAACVRVFDKATRQEIRSFPTKDKEDKVRLFQPTNLAVAPDGRICVSDTGGFAVKIYDAEGNYLQTLGELGITPGQFALPKGIGVDRENLLYVLDAAVPVIQLFDKAGQLLMFFGQPANSGEAGLYLPAGLTIDYDNVQWFKKYVAPGQTVEYLILVTNQLGPQKVSVFGFLKPTGSVSTPPTGNQ